MIRIKYGPNQQGIREVEIQPQIMDNTSQKKPEQRKMIAKQGTSKKNKNKGKAGRRKTEDNSTPPIETKQVCKQTQEASKVIPKKKTMVWQKKEKAFAPSSPGQDASSKGTK
jgi:hypothetical protein